MGRIAAPIALVVLVLACASPNATAKYQFSGQPQSEERTRSTLKPWTCSATTTPRFICGDGAEAGTEVASTTTWTHPSPAPALQAPGFLATGACGKPSPNHPFTVGVIEFWSSNPLSPPPGQAQVGA